MGVGGTNKKRTPGGVHNLRSQQLQVANILYGQKSNVNIERAEHCVSTAGVPN